MDNAENIINFIRETLSELPDVKEKKRFRE